MVHIFLWGKPFLLVVHQNQHKHWDNLVVSVLSDLFVLVPLRIERRCC